jgi:hypothetical protein
LIDYTQRFKTTDHHFSLEAVVKFKKFQIHIYLVQEAWAPEEASFYDSSFC